MLKIMIKRSIGSMEFRPIRRILSPLDERFISVNSKNVCMLVFSLVMFLAFDAPVRAMDSVSVSTSPELTVDFVRLYAQLGFDVTAKTGQGKTLLHRAAQQGNKDLALYLIDKGAKFDAQDDAGTTFLDEAMMYGPTDFIEFFINDVCNLAHFAKLSLQLGYDVDVRNDKKETLLHRAGQEGNIPLALRLISLGANVNACDGSGKTFLHHAILNGHAPFVEFFITRDITHALQEMIKKQTSVFENSCALETVPLRTTSSIQFFLGQCIDINAQDSTGMTLLHSAVQKGNEPLVDLLIKQSADVNAKDNRGATCLHYAAQYSTKKMIELFIDKGLDSNAKDKAGATCLHYAIEDNKPDTVKFLIDDMKLDRML